MQLPEFSIHSKQGSLLAHTLSLKKINKLMLGALSSVADPEEYLHRHGSRSWGHRDLAISNVCYFPNSDIFVDKKDALIQTILFHYESK